MRARNLGIVSAFVAAAIAIVLSIPISGIYGVEEKAEVQAIPSTLRIGFLQNIDSLNPYVGLNDASYLFYSLVYDALTCVDDKMNATGNLALSNWVVPTTDPKMVLSGEPYGSVWQYNLTHNAYWHDGEPFTADDVVWNIQANSENYTSMWAFQPYTYYMKWAEKIDDYTVRIHFYDRASGDSMPVAYGYSLPMYMLPKHLLGYFPANNLSFTWPGYFDNIAPAPPVIGTGPFMVTQSIYDDWLAGDPITLVKNPNYHWGPDYGKSVQFDRLQMSFHIDPTGLLYALEVGEIDVAQLSPQGYLSLKTAVQAGSVDNFELFDGPKITQYFTEITFCMNKSGTDPARLDRVVREALSMATNKSWIAHNIYYGLAQEATTIIPPFNSKWHYEPNATEKAQMAYNLTKAAQLLEDGGYRYPSPEATVRVATADSLAVKLGLVPEGTPLQFEMVVRMEHPEEKETAIFLQETWAQIGVQLNFLVVEEPELSRIVYTYNYDTAIWYWTSDIDPNYMLFAKSSASWTGWNDNLWDNASYEDNYSLSLRTLDYAERKTYVDNCQRIEFLDADYILLVYPNQTYAWRNDTFSGWGDWAANPGRSLDNYYTANPLWFDLVASVSNTAPTAAFTVVPATGPMSTDFVVDASTSSDVEDTTSDLAVRWDWENNGVWDTAWSTVKVANHTYDTNGTFVITLQVKDTGGLTAEATKTVVVTNTAPTASFVVSPTSGKAGTTFEFDASGSSDPEDPLNELQVRWDWNGDGAWDTVWSTQKTASHKYDDAGTYNVGLQVMDSGGSVNTTHMELEVEKPSTVMWIAVGGVIIAVAVVGLAFYFLRMRPK